MPDVRLLLAKADDPTVMEMGLLLRGRDDFIGGIYSLGQTVALMMFDSEYGNLGRLHKQRVDYAEIRPIVMQAVDAVERAMIEEQSGLRLPESEVLRRIEAQSIEISASEVQINLLIENAVGEQETVVL